MSDGEDIETMGGGSMNVWNSVAFDFDLDLIDVMLDLDPAALVWAAPDHLDRSPPPRSELGVI